MKKRVKILGALTVATLATAGLVSCGSKNEPSEQSSESSATPSSESSSSDASKGSSSSKPSEQSSSSDTSSSSGSDVTPSDVISAITIDSSNATVEYLVGESFSANGIVVKDNFGNTLTSDQYNVDESKFDNTKTGSYEIVIWLKNSENKIIKNTYSVSVVNEIVVEVSNASEFVSARAYKNSEGINNKTIKLTADIDLSGVTLTDADSTFTGVFDGNGHTIKNVSYTTGAKQGLLFDEVKGGTIKNTTFFNCTVIGSGESAGLVVGTVDGDAEFSNIEVSMCTVDNSGQNYAGILFARQTTVGTINVEKITVKNLSSVTCSQYGGMLMGDIVANSKLSVKNCDVDGTWTTTSGNGSYLCGRTRGGDITVENVIIRGEIKSSSEMKTVGFISANGSPSSLTVNNVLFYGVKSNLASSVDLIYGNKKPTTSSIKNVYIKTSNSVGCATTNATNKTDEVTYEWLTSETGLNLSSEVWESDSVKITKISGTSSNTPSQDATVSKLIASTGAVKSIYYKDKGSIPSIDGLVIAAQYSDGCVLAVDNSACTVKYYKADGTEVDGTKALDAGVYKVTVSYGGVSVDYSISVAELESISIDTSDVDTAYVAGSDVTLDTKNLHVYGNYSDGTNSYKILVDYTTSIANSEGTAVTSLSTSGDYTVTVTSKVSGTKSSTATYEINVVDAETVTGEVKVYVGASKENGKKNTEGNYQFKTIAKALDYLSNLGLADNTVKTIYLEEGTYNEKLTISLPNVRLIGSNADYTKTVISASVAAGDTTLDLTGTVGTYSSATVYITDKATNFVASGVYFKNDFDYNNSKLSDKQALAVRCDADESYFTNCGFYGNQDTLFARTGRQYYYNCTIEGNVDYIFGEDAIAYFKGCTIKSIARSNAGTNNGYVVATRGTNNASENATKVEYGFLFDGCNFTADEAVADSTMSIARPWGSSSKVAVINSTISKAYSTAAYDGSTKSRYADMSGVKPTSNMFVEYNNTGEGAISDDIEGCKIISAEEANAYVANIFKATNGNITFASDWDISTLEETTRYVVYYEGASYYKVGDTYSAPSVDVYKLIGSINAEYTEAKISDYKVVIKNSEGTEVTDTSTITSTAGEYSIEIKDGENVAYMSTITVTANEHHDNVSYSVLDNYADVTTDKTSINTGTVISTDGKLSTIGSVNVRVNKGASYCLETVKYGSTINGFAITVDAGCTITFNVASTGSSNTTSKIGVFDSNSATTISSSVTAVKVGDTAQSSIGLQSVTGSSDYVSLSFTVSKAGTYVIGSLETGRGFRIKTISVTYNN